MAAARAGALAVACLVAAMAAAALLLASPASAQSGCTTTLISLYPCLNYISGNVSTPPSSCCSQLASVVQSNPQCLCAALSGDSSSLGGVTIDKTRALALPQACNVKTPPASKCNRECSTNANPHHAGRCSAELPVLAWLNQTTLTDLVAFPLQLPAVATLRARRPRRRPACQRPQVKTTTISHSVASASFFFFPRLSLRSLSCCHTPTACFLHHGREPMQGPAAADRRRRRRRRT